jgi:molybdenum cofactor synthesis domain-containing protein
MTTAAAIIIGDEILSGKVRDRNAGPLIDLLAELGVDLQRIAYISDEEDDIISEVRSCSDKYDVVITSGGVGPTHDDRTVPSIAAAFGVAVEVHPDLEKMIRAWWGERFTEAALRIGQVPVGSRLLYSGDGLIPLVQFRNIFIFPGIPRLFAAKIGALKSELIGSERHRRNLHLSPDESAVADRLAEVDRSFPEVKIGSYPRSEGEDHRVWVTLEGTTASAVDAALDRLLEVLDADEVVRVERPNEKPP